MSAMPDPRPPMRQPRCIECPGPTSRRACSWCADTNRKELEAAEWARSIAAGSSPPCSASHMPRQSRVGMVEPPMSLRMLISARYQTNAWVRLAAVTAAVFVSNSVLFAVAWLGARLEWTPSAWVAGPALIAWILAVSVFFTWLCTAAEPSA